MVEHLGPNMARTVMGPAYNPAFEYTLVTDEEGFHVLAHNPEDDSMSCIKLDPEAPDPERLTPIWDLEKLENEGRKQTVLQSAITSAAMVLLGSLLIYFIGRV